MFETNPGMIERFNNFLLSSIDDTILIPHSKTPPYPVPNCSQHDLQCNGYRELDRI